MPDKHECTNSNFKQGAFQKKQSIAQAAAY